MSHANDPSTAQEGTGGRQTGQEDANDLREPQAATDAPHGRTAAPDRHRFIKAAHCDHCWNYWLGAIDRD